ncbi:MAG: site-specific integrase, partial [Gammaproteobacteria bacterium]|nr:site-specific integrase [Gammaproteobacteria bacterium]
MPALMTIDPSPNTVLLSAAELRAIEQFTDALWMEHGLSKNTLTAYRNDLTGLSVWLAKQGR